VSDTLAAAPTRVFISHVTTEAPVASLIGSWIQRPGLESFVASDNISAGTLWLQSLRTALERADIVLVLASRRSVARNWVWFEAGSAWVDAKRRCIPVCFEDGFGPDALPQPLASLQAIDIATVDGMQSLFVLAGMSLSAQDADARLQELEQAIAKSRMINPKTARTVSRAPGPGVLIDASHEQGGWAGSHQLPSLLKRSNELTSALDIGNSITLRWIERREQIWRHDLSTWAGIALAIPYHTPMTSEVAEEIREWVLDGGRLLLMGFELGDRHHKTNLNQLADRFGLHFNTDILAPTPEFTGKPHGEPVDVDVSGANHPLLSGLATLRVWNAQSVSIEPGGTPLIPLHGVGLSHLRGDKVHYDEEGWQVAGNQQFTTTVPPDDRYLAAFAPDDLCGRGRVLAMGTWDFRIGQAPATARFVTKVVRWLATGQAEP